MPIAPYQAVRWRLWFIASVATRSPGFDAQRLERLRHPPGVMGDARASWCG